MKHLFFGLLVLTTLASCGKSNTVGGTAAAAPAVSTPVTSAITVTGQVETQLAQIIDGNQFGLGQATYYETWAQVVAKMPNTTYNYGNYTATQSNPNCKTYLSIIQVCSNSSSTSNISVSRSVVHSSVDLVTKQNEIKAIINRRSMVQSAGYGVFYIRTTDNSTYIIDQRLPIQANPVQTTSASGSGETLVSVQ